MPKLQCKNTANNNLGNMAPPEPNYAMTAKPEHSNSAETQENDLKTNIMEMIKILKKEIKEFL